MGILGKFFGRASSASAEPSVSADELQVECPHTTLMARWDSVDDMGKDDKAIAYICDSCEASFTPEEGRMLRETTAERLHVEEIERARLNAEREGSAQ